MAVTTKPVTEQAAPNIQKLLAQLKAVFGDLEDQLNARAPIYVTNGKIPAGIEINSVVIDTNPSSGKISIKTKTKTGFKVLTAAMIDGIPTRGLNFRGVIEGTVNPPIVCSFPNNPKDWGFYFHTVLHTGWIWINYNGFFIKAQLT